MNGPNSPIGVGTTPEWSVIVVSNGQILSPAQLGNQVHWFIDGQTAGGTQGEGTLSLPITSSMVGNHTLSAEYLGTESSITITVVA
jgi:hypothetical protein